MSRSLQGAARGGLRGRLVVLLLVVAHFALASRLLVPGPFSMDELMYAMMTRAKAAGEGFVVDNGYSVLPSPELAVGWLMDHGGRLVSQYPELWPLLNAPGWRVLGFDALFWSQVVLLPLLTWGTWLLTREAFADPRLAAASVGILVACTYLYEYALGAWPHLAAATAFVFGLWLTVRALLRREPLAALAAGAIAATGAGLRLDAAVALPAALFVLLFAQPGRPREAAAYVVGAMPPLIALAIVNWQKFGRFSPLSYGREPSRSTDVASYLPLVVALLVAAAALAWVRRRGLPAPFRGAPVVSAVIVASGLATLLLLVPGASERVVRMLSGAWQLGIDLRVRPESAERALVRSAGGALVYVGGVKKSLVQSLPWAAALLLPLVRILRGGGERRPLAALAAPPAAAFAAFSLFAWHGGQALNLRYFVTFLPALAALGAWSARELLGPIDRRQRALLAGGALLAAAVFLPQRPWLSNRAPVEALEWLLLDLPLAIGGLLAAAALAATLLSERSFPATRRIAAVLLGVAFAWSTFAAMGYDLPRTRRHRQLNLALGSGLAAVVPPGALLFVDAHEPYAVVVDRRDVLLAMPHLDAYGDFERLARRHAARGRAVAASFDLRHWEYLNRNARLERFEVEPLGRVDRFGVARLTLRSPSTADGREAAPPAGGDGHGAQVPLGRESVRSR